jgi:hypothetical protein
MKIDFENRIKESIPDIASGSHSNQKPLALALPVAESLISASAFYSYKQGSNSHEH